jgi:hypothetical protein
MPNERNARLNTIAATVSWLKAEVEDDERLAFLSYLFSMAEDEVRGLSAARSVPKRGREVV